MTASQSGVFSLQQFTDLGAPLVGGRLYTYTFGTTTQKTAYTNQAGTVAHTYTSDGLGGQYIALNARGELPAPLYLTSGSYDIALKRADGSTVWTRRADPTEDSAAQILSDLADDTNDAKGADLIGYEGRTVRERLLDVISVKDFGATGDGTTDDSAAIQAAFDAASVSTSVYFPDGVYALSTKVRQHTSGVTIRGSGRYSAMLIPRSDFLRVANDCLLEVGTAGTNSHVVRDLGVLATYNSDGNDLSGLAIDADYNVDVKDCYLQSGNQITRENGGLLIRRGKHTTIERTHMHNGYAYGALIQGHNVGLKFLACAFDETPVAIKSTGNIVEMVVTSDCSFGACAPNATHPTTSAGSQIDLTTGAHTLVSITSNSFLGNVNTKFSINVNDVQVLTVDGNVFSGIRRYAVCHRGAKQLIVSDNAFYECGADGSTNTASAGTTNPDTSTFCCEVFKASAFNKSTTLVGNATDNTARPMAWIEGTSTAPATSATTIMGNNAQGGAAYIHGVSVADSRPFVNGKRLIEALVPVSFTIPSLAYTAGQSQFGNFTYSGLETTDVLTASADINMPAGMILNVRVLSAGTARWIVTNQTGAGVTPPAVTAVAVATKA